MRNKRLYLICFTIGFIIGRLIKDMVISGTHVEEELIIILCALFILYVIYMYAKGKDKEKNNG